MAPVSERSVLGPNGLSGSTLEELILDVWEDLTGRGRAECPVCADELRRIGCHECGARLT